MKVSARYEPVSDEASRAQGDRLVTWLRDYGERRINSQLIDERRGVPPHVPLDFGRVGLFGIQVDQAYGGLALRTREVARVLEQTAALDLGLGTFLLVCLGPGIRPIAAFGGDALKARVLPDLANGRQLAGYAQTEPGAGTDFPNMAATAVAEDGGWRLSGDKVWIGNATWAGVLTVMAHEVDAGGRRRGISAWALPTDRDGVRLGRELLSMGMRGVVQAEVGFRDVRVEPDELLGTSARGLEVGVDSMSWSRFAIASTCIGAMKRCAQLLLRFAGRRSIATGRLLENPVARVAFGETVARIAACEALLYRVADLLDAGESVSTDLFAACKIVASEFLCQTADQTMQILGSRGYDESNFAAQLLRDARVTRIFEGASEPLIAYVGQQALSARSDLHDFLRDDLTSPGLADELDRSVSALRGRAIGEPAAALERPWQCALAGEAALWALLAAVVERAEPGLDPSGRSAEWCREHFRAACANASGGSPRERVLLSVEDVERAVASYEATVGDTDQHLPGERIGLDPLLRRD